MADTPLTMKREISLKCGYLKIKGLFSVASYDDLMLEPKVFHIRTGFRIVK